MGTEILRPQDCLTDRIGFSPVIFTRRKSFYPNKPNRKQKRVNQPDPAIRRSSSDDLRSGKSLVLGQVAILRRGESLDSKAKEERVKIADDLMIYGTNRLGPDPDTVQKQIRKVFMSPVSCRSDVYAGSAFALSPEPSSLPLPSFPKKKQCSVIVDDSATRDLRRLLRLD